jgi:hypothetical protein
MTPEPADHGWDAEVIPLRASGAATGARPSPRANAAYVAPARSEDRCISCGDPDLVDGDLCADCLPLHPQPVMDGAR